jgi:hypothetical protein
MKKKLKNLKNRNYMTKTSFQFLQTIVFVFITHFANGQVQEKSKWILVSRNNYRVHTFYKDSITITTSDGFDLNKAYPESKGKTYSVIKKITEKDFEAFHLKNNEKDFIFRVVKIDNSHIQASFSDYTEKKFKNISYETMEAVYNLVSESETEKYPTLRDFRTITDSEIIIILKHVSEIKKVFPKVERHTLYSEFKYKLVSMGINPKFQLSEIEDLISKSKNIEVIELSKQIIN